MTDTDKITTGAFRVRQSTATTSNHVEEIAIAVQTAVRTLLTTGGTKRVEQQSQHATIVAYWVMDGICVDVRPHARKPQAKKSTVSIKTQVGLEVLWRSVRFTRKQSSNRGSTKKQKQNSSSYKESTEGDRR